MPTRPVVVRAAFRPPEHLLAQAALSFTGLLRQPGEAGLSPVSGKAWRLMAHGDYVIAVDHLGGLGQDHRVDGGVDLRDLEEAVGAARLPASGWWGMKPGPPQRVARGQDVDDPVMLDVGDRRGVGRCGAPRAFTKLVSSRPIALVRLRRFLVALGAGPRRRW